MFSKVFLCFCLAFFLTNSNATLAQNDSELNYKSDFVGETCRLQTIPKIRGENNQYLGRVLKDDGREIAIIDEFLGLVIIKKHEILSIIILNEDGSSVASTAAFTFAYDGALAPAFLAALSS